MGGGGVGLEEAGNCLCLQTSEPLEWTPGTQAGRDLKHAASVCVYAQTHGEGFIELFHTRLPPTVELFRNPLGDANKKPDPTRPGLEAAQTYLLGRHSAPRPAGGSTTLRSGTRVQRGALCARFSQGN